MKKKVCLSAAICFLLMQIAGAQYPIQETINPDDWGTLVFDEGFDKPLDDAIWYPQQPSGNVDPNHFYCAKPANVFVENGLLRLEARRESCEDVNYTSGYISSKQKFLYGYFEINCKWPAGHGFWPAFWLYGPGAGKDEIDAFEADGNYPHDLQFNVHCSEKMHDCNFDTRYCNMTMCDGLAERMTFSSDFTTGYHTFGALWTSDHVYFYVDRVLRYMVQKTYVYAMSIIANLGLSKNGFFGTYGVDETAPFPANMYIDYIKAWQFQDCTSSVEYCDYVPNDDSYNTVMTGQNITLGSAVNTCNVTLSKVTNEWWYIPRYLDLYATSTIKLDAGVKIEEGARFSANIVSCPPGTTLKSAPVEDLLAGKKIPLAEKVAGQIPRDFKIFPNPSNGMFTLQLPDQSKGYEVVIHNQLGEVIYQKRVFPQNQVDMDLRLQPKGVYVVEITSATETYKTKIIIE